VAEHLAGYAGDYTRAPLNSLPGLINAT